MQSDSLSIILSPFALSASPRLCVGFSLTQALLHMLKTGQFSP